MGQPPAWEGGLDTGEIGLIGATGWNSDFQFASFHGCSDRVLRAGTVIPAVLISAVHSDLDGIVRAQVAHDVFYGLVRCVVVPAGTMLLGIQQEGARIGQNRIVVVWTALQLPTGETVVLPNAQSADRAGASGIPGKVDRRTREVFGEAMMISAIAGAVAVAQPGSRSGRDGYYESPGERASAAVGQQLNETTRQYLERNVQIGPTIHIAGGTRFHVMLATDLDLDRKETGEAGEQRRQSQSAGARDRVVGL
jgi:type IV secretion system protein VirB10